MTKTAEAPEEETTKAPKKEMLQEGQVSIIVEGKEVVFDQDVRDFPGMPDISRLRQLAGAFVKKTIDVEEQRDLLDKVKQEIMLQLRQEGRTSFAYRAGGSLFVFEITATEEKLDVKKKK